MHYVITYQFDFIPILTKYDRQGLSQENMAADSLNVYLSDKQAFALFSTSAPIYFPATIAPPVGMYDNY